MKDLQQIYARIEEEISNFSYPDCPNLLYSPINYIMSLRAKRIRPLFLLIAYQLFDEDFEKALAPALGIEFFHNFTLLHDDIMDNAPLRRGNLTVHEKWSSNVAILSGDAMMINAYMLIAKVDQQYLKQVMEVFGETAIKVCEGQQLDMDFEVNDEVSLTEYIHMIKYKTAILFAASLKIGSIIAGAERKDQDHLYQFGINIGIAFQLKDDMLDVFGSPENFGKQLGGDILANKKTFLYLKALQLSDGSTKKRLYHYYSLKEDINDKVDSVRALFTELNVEKHTVDMMKAYYTKAMKHLAAVNSSEKEVLIMFANKLMDRNS